MSHEIIKGAAVGAGAGLISFVALRAVDMIPTHYAIEGAKVQLDELASCETGALPVQISGTGQDKAGVYDITCGESDIPLIVTAEGSSLTINWAATRQHVEAVADQGYIGNVSDNEAVDAMWLATGCTAAGAVVVATYAKTRGSKFGSIGSFIG